MAWHYLRHNRRTAVPHNLAFVDCETWPIPGDRKLFFKSHTLRLGVATGLRLEGGEVTRRDECRFTTIDEFWKWLCGRMKQREPLWLFAHNASFDYPICGLLHQIDAGNLVFPVRAVRTDRDGEMLPAEWFDSAIVAIDHWPIIIKGEVPGRGKLVALDTMNFFPMRLKKLGDAVGLEKLVMPDWLSSEQDWWDYCRNDTLIVEQSITRLIGLWESIDGGNVKMTAGGMAMSLYRHKFLKTPILFHDDLVVKEHERRGYFGGQLECFRIGHFVEPMYALDVNSLYPFVMLTNLFPRRLAAWHTPTTCKVDRPLAPLDDVMADVLIDSDFRPYPVKWGAGHQYACGTFRTVLTGPELTEAEQWGDVREYYGWSRYRLANLFQDYMEFVLGLRRDMRAAGDGIGAEFAKLLSVSLGAKFAQWEPDWQPAPEVDALDDWTPWHYWNHVKGTAKQYRSIGYNVFEYVGKIEKENTLPAIAAFMTTYGRHYMASLRKLAGWHNVYYQAVDSLHVNQCGYDNLRSAGMLDETEPGKLKVEATDREAKYHGLHRYSCGERSKKGAVKFDAKLDTDGKWKFETFEKLPRICGRSPDGTVRTFKREILLDDNRYGSRVGQDGWVEPLLLGRGGDAASAIDPAIVVSAAERARAAAVRS